MAVRLAQLSEILPADRRSLEVRRASVISQPPWLPEDSGALDPPRQALDNALRVAHSLETGDRHISSVAPSRRCCGGPL